MLAVQFDYSAPTTLDEALSQLVADGNARLLAGGTSLLPDLRLRRVEPRRLIDLRQLSELVGVDRGEPTFSLRIGAMTTLAQIVSDEDIRTHVAALADAINSISDPQVRNRATIGGSLARNDPTGDIPAAALALHVAINVVGKAGGHRRIPMDEFIVGPSRTSLKSDEIITSVDLPAHATRMGSAYEKFPNPASGYAICGVAATVGDVSGGRVGWCRVAVTGAVPHAVRLRRVEIALAGKHPTKENLAEAARSVATEGLPFVGDLAASADYRAHLTQVLAERALARAVDRAMA